MSVLGTNLQLRHMSPVFKNDSKWFTVVKSSTFFFLREYNYYISTEPCEIKVVLISKDQCTIYLMNLLLTGTKL